jgi:hypothetical protein
MKRVMMATAAILGCIATVESACAELSDAALIGQLSAKLNIFPNQGITVQISGRHDISSTEQIIYANVFGGNWHNFSWYVLHCQRLNGPPRWFCTHSAVDGFLDIER